MDKEKLDQKQFEWVTPSLLKILYFDEGALAALNGKGSLITAIGLVLAAVVLQSSFSEKAFQLSFLGSAAKFFGAILVIYIAIKILSSKSHFRFEQLLMGISLACVLGFACMWLLLGVGYMLLGAGAYNILLQVKEIYMMLMFSFSAEVFSELRGWKSVAIGLVGITVLLIFSYLLG